MPFQVDLDDLRLTADERSQLAEVLGCAEANLNAALRNYARAALEEYVRMFLGQNVATRTADIREFRLLMLVSHVFKDKMPGEQRISSLFQTTVLESRSLIRSLLTKRRYELRAVITKTLAEVIQGATKDDDEDVYTFSVESQQLVDQLNQMLADHDGTLPKIVRRPNTVNTYVLWPSSREHLCEKLGLQH